MIPKRHGRWFLPLLHAMTMTAAAVAAAMISKMIFLPMMIITSSLLFLPSFLKLQSPTPPSLSLFQLLLLLFLLPLTVLLLFLLRLLFLLLLILLLLLLLLRMLLLLSSQVKTSRVLFCYWQGKIEMGGLVGSVCVRWAW